MKSLLFCKRKGESDRTGAGLRMCHCMWAIWDYPAGAGANRRHLVRGGHRAGPWGLFSRPGKEVIKSAR